VSELATLRSQIDLLIDLLLETGLGRSFSKVKWVTIAPLVGIEEPWDGLSGVPYFDLQRAHVPEHIFNGIRKDIDARMHAYGYIFEHENEDVSSRVMALVSKLH